MPKQSSASKATRKKAEAKAAKKKGEPTGQDPKPSGSKKRAKNEPPRKKQYIAPQKPKGAVDPVDLYGIGGASSHIDPQTIVTLRLLHKRDEKTLFRGLEEYASWLSSIAQEDEYQVLSTLPVWIYHFPKLAAHSSRRVRATTASIHMHLLNPSCSDIRSSMLSSAELLSAQFCATWLCLAHDADRTIRQSAMSAWSSSTISTTLGEGIDLIQLAPDLTQHLAGVVESAYAAATPSEPTSGDEGNSSFNMTDTAEEDSQSRSARLVTSAIEALAFLFKELPARNRDDAFLFILRCDTLWALLRNDAPDAVNAIPSVRKATWGFMEVVLTSGVPLEEDALTEVARNALPGALEDNSPSVQSAMWKPFLGLLQAHPTAWGLAAEATEEANDDIVDQNDALKPNPAIIDALLNFIGHNAPLQAAQNFPAIILLVLSVPRSFFDFYDPKNSQKLLSAYWNGPTSQPMVDSLLEVLLLIAKEQQSGRQELVAAQAPILAEALLNVNRRTRIHTGTLKAFLDKVQAVDEELAPLVTESLEKKSRLLLEAHDDKGLKLLSHLLIDISSRVPDAAHPLAYMVSNTVQQALTQLQQSDSAKTNLILLGFVATTWQASLPLLSPTAKSCLDSVLLHVLPSFILEQKDLSPAALALFQSYLISRKDPSASNTAWQALLNVLPAAEASQVWDILEPLIKLAASNLLPQGLQNAQLDHFIREQVNRSILSETSGSLSEKETNALANLFIRPEPFIDPLLPGEVLTLIAHQVESRIDSVLLSSASVTSSALNEFKLLAAWVPRVLSPNMIPIGIFKAAFLAGSLLSEDNAALASSALAINQQVRGLNTDNAALLRESVQGLLRNLLGSTSSSISPAHILDALEQSSKGVDRLSLLPEPGQLEQLRNSAIAQARPSIRLVLSDVVLTPDACFSTSTDNLVYTSQAYIRAVLAALKVLSEQINIVRQNLWLLPHIVLLRILAQDERNEPSETFQPDLEELEALVSLCDATVAYILSSLAAHLPDDWHQVLTLQIARREQVELDPLQRLILSLFDECRSSTASSYVVRTLHYVLSSVLRNSDPRSSDYERWFDLARTLQTAQPDLFVSLVSLTVSHLPDNAKIARLKNSLASELSAVKPADADARGRLLLRQIIAFAPSEDSEETFLPQQRVVFVLSNLQSWIRSDEAELGDAVTALLSQFSGLVSSVLQDISGAHWDLMFDVAEMNIEYADWADQVSLPGLYRACQFLEGVRDLYAANKGLREIIGTRLKDCTQLVQTLVLTLPEDLPRSKAVSSVANLAIEICQQADLPVPTSEASLEQLLSLTRSLLPSVRSAAVEWARASAEATVKALVVEAELQEEGALSISLPTALVARLSISAGEPLLHWLLSWNICFDFLSSASTLVRGAYIDNLRSRDLLASSLLPVIFGILNDRAVSSNLSIWSWTDLDAKSLEDSTESVSLLAAHIYYRSLLLAPSLVRHWYEGTKDRQLALAITSITSRYFSTVIIASELGPLGKPAKKVDPFAEGGLTVKVASNVNEVKATYVVDEQPMELTIRLPSDYPLSQADINLKRVAVSEATYRAWLLGVQQVITSGNARISDALDLFERNVSLHFDGVEACAICYSIISPTDRRLPSKKCRTCKNILHAGCLFKWFATSHGSSCPLCRSLF